MTLNYPGPYGLRIFYTCTPSGMAAMEHVLELNVDCTEPPDPGALFSQIEIVGSSSDIFLDDLVDAFVLEMKDLLSASDVTIDRAELWQYEEFSFLANYISSYTINVAGTSASTTVVGHAMIFSARTAEGGTMKMYVLENTQGGNEQETYAQLNATNKALADVFIGSIASGKHFLGRDTSYPVAFLRLSRGQHEALWKRRYRP